MTQAQTFNAAYNASRDPRVLALLTIDPMLRYDTAFQLALKNVTPPIDDEIDVRGSDPFLAMQQRVNIGLKWVPSVLQPNLQTALVGSQQPNPPFVPYDVNAPLPANACLCTIDLAALPPAFAVPAPVPTHPEIDPTPTSGDKLVGGPKGGSWYDISELAHHKALGDGFVWTLEGDGHIYMLHVGFLGSKLWQRLN